MRSYDVIIAGSGISGLLLGAFLSSELNVLILEKESFVPRNKYWLTDEQCANEHKNLSECIETIYESMDYIAYDGTKATVTGNSILWNTDRLVELLYNIIRKNGGVIETECSIYSIWNEKKNVRVKASNEDFSTRLLIDCMGNSSPLVLAKQTVSIVGRYSVAGAIMETAPDISPIALQNVMLQKKPSYLEVFPRNDNKAYVAMIAPSVREDRTKEIMKHLHFVTTQTDMAEMFLSVDGPPLIGTVPVGIVKKPCLNRVFFFGEAGQCNPSCSATALTRMLYSVKETSKLLSQKIQADTLTKKDLKECCYLSNSRLNRKIQMSFFKQVLKFNSDKFRQLVVEMDKHPDKLVNDLIFSTYRFSPFDIGLLFRRGILGQGIRGGFI